MMQKMAVASLFSVIVDTQSFHYLRTELKLGYVAFARLIKLMDSLVLGIFLQGTSFTDMKSGISTFYAELKKYIVSEFKDTLEGAKNPNLVNLAHGEIDKLN